MPHSRLVCQALVKQLWEDYRGSLKAVSSLEQALNLIGINQISLDHFAVIDLPGKHSGIPVLSQLFSEFGYEFRGRGYLPDKQNDFVWMAESHSKEMPANQALPQVVVADFRLEELPAKVRAIVEKYANQIPKPPLDEVRRLTKEQDVLKCLRRYFSGRDWALPTVSDFKTVQEANELLAWVLVFGRQANHFGLSIHLMSKFNGLDKFLQFVHEKVKLPLNSNGGLIKGTREGGIIQGATAGELSAVMLADGVDAIPKRFVEFVWRYPTNVLAKPMMWEDYFTGFIADQADFVIESLYE